MIRNEIKILKLLSGTKIKIISNFFSSDCSHLILSLILIKLRQILSPREYKDLPVYNPTLIPAFQKITEELLVALP